MNIRYTVDACDAFVHLAGQTIEVPVSVARGVVDAISQAVTNQTTSSFALSGDLGDIVFLIGPSTPIIVDLPPETLPRGDEIAGG